MYNYIGTLCTNITILIFVSEPTGEEPEEGELPADDNTSLSTQNATISGLAAQARAELAGTSSAPLANQTRRRQTEPTGGPPEKSPRIDNPVRNLTALNLMNSTSNAETCI